MIDLQELLLTSAVLETAKQIRKNENFDKILAGDEPVDLGPYIAKAVEQLAAWHPHVMKAVKDQAKK